MGLFAGDSKEGRLREEEGGSVASGDSLGYAESTSAPGGGRMRKRASG